MSAVQLAFTLRTSTNVKTVHLLGSWDNYAGQLPLSKDAAKAGSWKGNFRFQTSTLKPGQRYWYYYIMDGYHVSHDPAKPATKEPTTGRQLNILDVPKSGAAAPAKATGPVVPTGRGVSPSRIVHPKPSKPYASRGVREADYSASPVDDLTGQLEASSLYADRFASVSPPSSISSGSSISSRSDGASSPSSLSSLSDRSASSCRCNRYGITRRGDKVLLDCGGSKCGYSDDSSSGCSSEEDDDSEASSSEEEEEIVQVKRKQQPVVKTIAPRTSTTKKVSATRRR
jgi:hypothetical protein